MTLAIPEMDEGTRAAVDQTAGYLVLKEAIVRNVNGDGHLHHKDTVLSAHEVEPYVKQKVAEGSHRYTMLLEPLTAEEVAKRRETATRLQGDVMVDGQRVSPPFPDYVGLHPEEILQRMHDCDDLLLIQQVRLYERGSLARTPILEYTAPAEREPWPGYDSWEYNAILDKLDLLNPEAVMAVMAYESAHRKRPAVLTYESPTQRAAASSLIAQAAQSVSEDDGEKEDED